jgi:hypothetical protein
MGRPHEANRSAQQFEQLCHEYLADLGFRVEAQKRVETLPVLYVDLVATQGQDTLYVEVKWTHRPMVYLRVLREWAAQTAKLLVTGTSTKAVLMVSGTVASDHKGWVEREFGIEVWDIDFLIRNVRSNSLVDRFENFKATVSHFVPDGRPLQNRSDITSASVEDGLGSDTFGPANGSSSNRLESEVLLALTNDDAENRPEGEKLIAELSALKKGKKGAAAYELLCERIISYLFKDALAEPKKQKRTIDGLNIMDIVYRVIPGHRFWDTLTRDFRARVILFECKNYSASVGPMQVYTSERYINPLALRPICFMLTRKAPSQHARQAAFGAMRESGKMMIFLDDSSVEAMLRLRDNQITQRADTPDFYDNDPTIELEARIYEFLAEIPR